MRVFAGPNGSGKSTLKSVLPPPLLGVYLNPDEIEEQIRDPGFLDLWKPFGTQTEHTFSIIPAIRRNARGWRRSPTGALLK
jgi:hypothetical protein